MTYSCSGRFARTLTIASAIFAGALSQGAAHAATTTFSYSGAPVAIPDAGAQVGAPILVSGMTDPVASVTMSIDGTDCTTVVGSGIDNTWVSDLVLTLRSPTGTDVIVVNRVGGSGDNFCQVFLDDAAATSIQTATSAQAPFTGTWQPNAPLSAFIGEAANGNWTLLAQDFALGDTGSIRAWSITITDSAVPPPAQAPTPVPTLSQWGMIVLSGLLAWFGLTSVRRQRQ